MDCRHLAVTFSVTDRPVCALVFLKALQVQAQNIVSSVPWLFVEGALLWKWLEGEKGGVNPCRQTTEEVGVCGMEALCIQQLYECSPDEGNLHFTNCVCPCVRWGSSRFSIQCFCTEILAAVMQMSSCQCCKDWLKTPHVFKFEVFMKFSFCSA